MVEIGEGRDPGIGSVAGCPSRFRDPVRPRVARPSQARPPVADSENAASPAQGSFKRRRLGFVRAPGLGFVRRRGSGSFGRRGSGSFGRRGSGLFAAGARVRSGAGVGRGRTAGRAPAASRSAQSRTIANGGGRPGSLGAGVGSARRIGPPPRGRPNPRYREGHPRAVHDRPGNCCRLAINPKSC